METGHIYTIQKHYLLIEAKRSVPMFPLKFRLLKLTGPNSNLIKLRKNEIDQLIITIIGSTEISFSPKTTKKMTELSVSFANNKKKPKLLESLVKLFACELLVNALYDFILFTKKSLIL